MDGVITALEASKQPPEWWATHDVWDQDQTYYVGIESGWGEEFLELLIQGNEHHENSNFRTNTCWKYYKLQYRLKSA